MLRAYVELLIALCQHGIYFRCTPTRDMVGQQQIRLRASGQHENPNSFRCLGGVGSTDDTSLRNTLDSSNSRRLIYFSDEFCQANLRGGSHGRSFGLRV
jgi:hypothetical protein